MKKKIFKKDVLSVSETQLEEMVKDRDDGSEDLCYGLCFKYESDQKVYYLLRDILRPEDEEVIRSRVSADPSPEFLCKLYDKFQLLGAPVILQEHTHPFSESPSFSSTDDESGRRLLQDASGINPDVEIIQIVFGSDCRTFQARVVSKGGVRSLNDLEVIGLSGLQRLKSNRAHELKGSCVCYDLRHSRSYLAFGIKGVDLIGECKVLVVGAGGLGSALIFLMQRQGFRNITAMDFDILDETSFNRFYFGTEPAKLIGKKKVSVAIDHLKKFNPEGKYKAIDKGVSEAETADEAIRNADVVMLALDDDGARAIALSHCARYGKPVINVSNALYKEEDILKAAYVSCQWNIPREPLCPCFFCQGSIDEEAVDNSLMSKKLKDMRRKAGYVVGTNETPVPQVVPINSVAAGVAVWELVSWVTGVKKVTPWIHYDLMTNKYEVLQGVGDDECSVCGLSAFSSLCVGEASSGKLKCQSEE